MWVGDAVERARLETSADVAEQAELRAMRAEISPHFVYNSLTAIASFVRSDPERARDLMLDFAAYTRHSLARHGDYTTVAGEFQAIEAYLEAPREGGKKGKLVVLAGAHPFNVVRHRLHTI